MPPSLHPHLKQVSASYDFYTCPDDVIEEPPLDHDDAEQRAAKRRRIEAIASQYLRGRPPVILTASLKGPFDNGWKNPWAKPPRKEKQRPLGRTGKSKAGRTDDVRQKRISRTQSTAHSLAPSIASPETSRATREINLSAREQDNSLSNVEIPASTAPLPDEDSVCPPADTFSADTGTYVRRQSPLTNPFWLRRPDSARANMRKAASEQTDTSPTRSRSRHRSQTESVAELQISLPKVPIQVQKPSPRGISPGYGRSSASASMDISSPARDDHITSSATVCQVQSATPPHSTHPGQRSQRTIPIVTSSMGSQSAISRDDIQRSAERLVDIMSASQLSGRKTSQKTHTPTQEDDTASPLPSLPTCQEIGKVIKASKPHKAKPRAVNFDSSPEKGSPATERGHEASALEGVTDGAESEEASEAGSPSGEDATDISEESEVLHQNHASRESEWSTQAAMVRAQLEFQQSTFPALSPATLGGESQAPLDTPRAMLAVSNPVTTPLTVLSVPRDEPLPNDSAFRGPAISTQDLFGAASPFSFSTAKKKPDDSQRSQLGFGISPTHIKALKPSEAASNSPSMNSERIPLKDKNTTSSFWSFVTDKASQGSPGRLGERSRCSMREIDVPHLNMDTSLDDFGRHYTGAFLRGIDDT